MLRFFKKKKEEEKEVSKFLSATLLQVLLIIRFLQHEHHLGRPINQVNSHYPFVKVDLRSGLTALQIYMDDLGENQSSML